MSGDLKTIDSKIFHTEMVERNMKNVVSLGDCVEDLAVEWKEDSSEYGRVEPNNDEALSFDFVILKDSSYIFIQAYSSHLH